MNIKDSVALVTGANRGFGLALTKALLERGARKVYAAARDISTLSTLKLTGVVPVELDVTKPDGIAALARSAQDVSLLVNNAGIMRRSSVLADDAVSALREELETNLFGPLNLCRAFAPILKVNGGGAILNVLSGLSWVTLPLVATYSISKAAAWSLTNGLRNELRGQGTQVVGLHIGFMATDLTKGIDIPKDDPISVASAALAGIEAGQDEVLADDAVRRFKRGLSVEPGIYLSRASA